jgi:sulfatase modifying factor 1
MKNHHLLFIFLLFFSCKSEEKKEIDYYVFSPNVKILKDAPKTYTKPVTPKNIIIPKGMVYVPGGFTQIGTTDGMPHERPMFWAEIKPFFMDISPVTVAQFREFVEKTHYKTYAENFGDGGFFDYKTQKWILKKGANWQYPLGKDQPKAIDNHPVTQVSWYDAIAYAKWAGKRLPSEIEWEHAARNATNNRNLYPFGNEIVVNGKALANTWNGVFPQFNKNTDGFLYTSPVGYFGKTKLGLTDMTGNVWQWCDNWKINYDEITNGMMPKDTIEKVEKGGSFLCEPGWCHGYRVSGRSFTTPETSLMHVGFRCVK